MVSRLRHCLASLLARWAARIDPEPQLRLTPELADLLYGEIVGRGIARRSFKPGDGLDYTY